MAPSLASLPDWNLNWFVHLFSKVPSPCSASAASVCHLNNKCGWFPDLVRGAGPWCILILLHSALYRGPSFIWIKEVEFKNSQCLTGMQTASIYCTEWWNGQRLCPSPPWHSPTSHKTKKDSPLALKDPSYSPCYSPSRGRDGGSLNIPPRRDNKLPSHLLKLTHWVCWAEVNIALNLNIIFGSFLCVPKKKMPHSISRLGANRQLGEEIIKHSQ